MKESLADDLTSVLAILCAAASGVVFTAAVRPSHDESRVVVTMEKPYGIIYSANGPVVRPKVVIMSGPEDEHSGWTPASGRAPHQLYFFHVPTPPTPVDPIRP